MKRKKLPTKKHKGLYIYCTDCKKYFSWTNRTIKQKSGESTTEEAICGDSKKKFSSCKSFVKHRFKSRIHIPGSNDRKASRTFEATSYADAVIQAIEFEKEFKMNIKLDQTNDASYKRHYLFDTQIMYLDFLDNIGVPEHQKIKRSERYIKEIQKSLLLFNESLTKNKINKKTTILEKISENHVGYFHEYLLKDKGYSNKTYNKSMSILRGFLKWGIKKFGLNIHNPFDDVRTRSVAVKKDTITKQEFKDLLDIISPENGSATTGIKNPKSRNRYKPYLKDGIELALHTGGRREEIVELKWSMIHEINHEPTYIKVRNLKVERQKGEGFNDNVAPKIIPITKSLLKLLHRLGYENKKGTDEYLLVPDRTKTSTYAIMDNLSKGFSHYYKQLDTGRDIQFKNLRKTYLTYLNSTLSGDTKSLSSHSTDDILQKHYIDEKIINKAVKELEIFSI